MTRQLNGLSVVVWAHFVVGVCAALLLPSTAAAQVESTGFETTDGWVAGFACGPSFFDCPVATNVCYSSPNPDTGWRFGGDTCVEPRIDTVNPSEGTQHLTFGFDPDMCIVGGCFVTATTPNAGPQLIGPTTISFDVAGEGNGPSLIFTAKDSVNARTALIVFSAGGMIGVFNVDHNETLNTIAPFVSDRTYRHVRIEINPCADRLEYFYDDVLIHQSRSDVGKTVALSSFQAINSTATYDIDNFLVSRGPECPPGTCGNNVMEEGEGCDGTDDWLCPGRCDTDCTCLPGGACCDFDLDTCEDGLLPEACSGTNQVYHLNETCCSVECIPPGEAYDSKGVEMLGHVPFAQNINPNVQVASDIWGYTSPSNREYAIIGLFSGTAFVDVTVPRVPVVIANYPGIDCTWRDIKTYQHYAYVVNDCYDGMDIYDLSQIDDGVVTLARHYTDFGFASSHNLALNPESGYAYLVSSNLGGGGLVALDLSDPLHPVPAGAWVDAYVHDAYVTSYTTGPYAGREIAFTFDYGDGLYIVDVTDKLNMFTVSHLNYPTNSVAHQGWMTDDKRYIFFGDEGDERNYDITTTTYMVDVLDLEHPQLINTFTNGVCSIDHNLMIRGGLTYLAGYTSGLRVLDTSDPVNTTEVAYFDTFPESNVKGYYGVWGVYAGFPSGIVIASDMTRGLFIFNYDCNQNGIDDTIDIANGTSLDANANKLPDECEVCVAPAAPTLVPNDHSKSRYLSIVPTTSTGETAMAVTIEQLEGFGASNGSTLWVGAPVAVPEEDSSHPGATTMAAPLVCEPYLTDWSSVGVVHVYGAEILPGSIYTVRAASSCCVAAGIDSGCASAPLQMTTGTWGDAAVPFDMPGGPAQPDFADISGIVSKFLAEPGAPIKALAQLQPNLVHPNQPIDFNDIAAAVSSFLGTPYATTVYGPCACPPPACGATCSLDSQCDASGICVNGVCADACGRCQP